MATRTHKRKRSLQDSVVDLSKMRMALNRLDALKEELDGVEETQNILDDISEHVAALEDILRGAKKPKVTFSSVTRRELNLAGVQRKRLDFVPEKVLELTNRFTTNEKAEIADLHLRIKEIYAHVNMDYEPGPRMILDAVLLTLAKISSTQGSSVAILPEMRIGTSEEGICILHPNSGYELWLSGNVDYAVIKYDDSPNNKARLLLPNGSREDVFDLSKGRLFLVEAKNQKSTDGLVPHIPEAVSQAIALLKLTNVEEVRFCLSDGESWIFFTLKSIDGILTYYESGPRRLSRDVMQDSDLALREIGELIQLICEWLSPTMPELITLQ